MNSWKTLLNTFTTKQNFIYIFKVPILTNNVEKREKYSVLKVGKSISGWHTFTRRLLNHKNAWRNHNVHLNIDIRSKNITSDTLELYNVRIRDICAIFYIDDEDNVAHYEKIYLNLMGMPMNQSIMTKIYSKKINPTEIIIADSILSDALCKNFRNNWSQGHNNINVIFDIVSKYTFNIVPNIIVKIGEIDMDLSVKLCQEKKDEKEEQPIEKIKDKKEKIVSGDSGKEKFVVTQEVEKKHLLIDNVLATTLPHSLVRPNHSVTKTPPIPTKITNKHLTTKKNATDKMEIFIVISAIIISMCILWLIDTFALHAYNIFVGT